jgi:hypothetical protein
MKHKNKNRNLEIMHILNLSLILIELLRIYSSRSTKPPFWKKPESARWLAHSNVWGTLSTTSGHLFGQAWGQPKSFVDGSSSNSTGNLYFYDSDMDTSIQVNNIDFLFEKFEFVSYFFKIIKEFNVCIIAKIKCIKK